MKERMGHLGRNIGALLLVLTAGCGASDALARVAGECQSADRYLARCGLGLDDPIVCSEDQSGAVHPVMTSDQAECIKKYDCGELRGQAAGGRICDVNVRFTDKP